MVPVPAVIPMGVAVGKQHEGEHAGVRDLQDDGRRGGGELAEQGTAAHHHLGLRHGGLRWSAIRRLLE